MVEFEVVFQIFDLVWVEFGSKGEFGDKCGFDTVQWVQQKCVFGGDLFEREFEALSDSLVFWVCH